MVKLTVQDSKRKHVYKFIEDSSKFLGKICAIPSTESTYSA